MWKMVKDDIYPGKIHRRFEKKWQERVENTFNNLLRYKETLELGTHPETAKRTLSFVHEEKHGLIAIDQ